MLAPLWLTVTAIGVVQIRQRRVADHRRWMIRSFALTMSIVINRLVGVPIFVALYLLLGTSDEQDAAADRRADRGLVELDPRGRAGRALPAARVGSNT